MQAEQPRCWSGMTDTEHSEAQIKQLKYIVQKTFKRTYQLKT